MMDLSQQDCVDIVVSLTASINNLLQSKARLEEAVTGLVAANLNSISYARRLEALSKDVVRLEQLRERVFKVYDSILGKNT